MADDSAIAQRIRDAINRNEMLRPLDIQVDVEQGVVTLRGTVDTEQSRALAEGLAGTAGGVEMVVNQLKVKEEIPDQN